jgi:hypothetical protein
MAAWGDVRRWQPAPLDEAVSALNAEYNTLITSSDDLREINTPYGWTGPAASSAATKGNRLIDGLEEWAAEIAAGRRSAGDVADALTGLRNGIDEAEELARLNHFFIGDDGSITDQGPPASVPPEQQQTVADQRRTVAAELRERVVQILRTAEDIDADFCAVLDRILSGNTIDADANNNETTSLAAAGNAGAALGSLSIPAPPPADATAAQNAAWWATLSEAQRTRLARDRPELVGPRDGVSTTQRDIANRILMSGQRQQLEQRRAEIHAELENLTNGPGHRGSRSHLQVELEELNAKIQGIDDIQARLDSNLTLPEDQRYYLLGINSEGDGTAVVARGNPDTAANVATFVPGTGSDLSNINTDIDRSDRMLDAARQNGSASTAVITWHGYDAPDSIPAAMLDSYAEDAEPEVADFQEGLREARADDMSPSHNTIVGHSYGGTTIGRAAQHHDIPVDDMILVGAPGVDTANAGDLRIAEGHVWATADPNDPVPDTYAHGRDCTDPDFGARVFSSNAQTEGEPMQGGYNVSSHSLYWEQWNPALNSIGRIIAGNPTS